ncbi:hypothetical protein SJ05684_c26000 [Sinorhizobium sojae CCBAU 05684]|uniref:Transmembrane protein n=1 Tax=Sinorhizobium sojae CCBAU 05684 TaxID=716928 RepID=A0A249PFK8_9HYPH|nr:hypothetical protein [Sinorhizobium sojae]ASY64039.1 hypothetical protein SJ05684_c26000 [Sinorhizobium sojae CCBAU 05684]
MNPMKAMIRSRYPAHAAPAWRRPVHVIPQSLAVLAAFAFVCAVVIGLI